MNVKKQFKNHMRPILNVDDCYDRVSRRIDFNEESDVIKKFHELSEKLIDYDSFYKSYEKSLELDKERKNKQE